ncbi:hypothetical protein OEOE_0924 [Oenococcus oeni PSU-1]|uniref:Uncharacterized protein n=1 Tax=Oenococcus oeni (strain ATCC BAA-331 / PSU-1) TaxID=203123 RepID=Q04FD4_OENOB|nr:hypothetical protein OEOE_0924 [Oenococcus oeni PSU-1]
MKSKKISKITGLSVLKLGVTELEYCQKK